MLRLYFSMYKHFATFQIGHGTILESQVKWITKPGKILLQDHWLIITFSLTWLLHHWMLIIAKIAHQVASRQIQETIIDSSFVKGNCSSQSISLTLHFAWNEKGEVLSSYIYIYVLIFSSKFLPIRNNTSLLFFVL